MESICSAQGFHSNHHSVSLNNILLQNNNGQKGWRTSISPKIQHWPKKALQLESKNPSISQCSRTLSQCLVILEMPELTEFKCFKTLYSSSWWWRDDSLNWTPHHQSRNKLPILRDVRKCVSATPVAKFTISLLAHGFQRWVYIHMMKSNIISLWWCLLLKRSTYVLWDHKTWSQNINVLLPAGCRKDISAKEGGELLKTDFANSLNSFNLWLSSIHAFTFQ